MPYEIYKMIHVVFVILFFSSLAVLLYGSNVKHFKILQGVATLFILVSGMGLLARIGVSHGQGWPAWVIYKLLIWAVIGISAPIIAKRYPKYGVKAFWCYTFLLVTVTYAVNYKP